MTAALDITPLMLPAVLRQIAELIGIDAAVKIARAFGGTSLTIPQTMGPDHKLAQLIGLADASTIAAHFGGSGRFECPSAKSVLCRADARRLRRAGKSTMEIAAALGISQRHVTSLVYGVPKGVGEGDDRSSPKPLKEAEHG
jgi:hypothetical protein